MYVIPTLRSKRITSSAYNLAYTRNFKIKKTALDSPRLGESYGSKYKKLFEEFVVMQALLVKSKISLG